MSQSLTSHTCCVYSKRHVASHAVFEHHLRSVLLLNLSTLSLMKISEILHLGPWRWGRFHFVGTNSPHRIPVERQTVNNCRFCQCFYLSVRVLLMWWHHHEFIVLGLIAAVPGDVQNSWQTVNHSVSTQDVGGVDLSIVNKQLEVKQTVGLLICSQDRLLDWLISFRWGPFRLGGRCQAGMRIRALSVCILQAEGRSSADVLKSPHGIESCSHPVQYKIKAPSMPNILSKSMHDVYIYVFIHCILNYFACMNFYVSILLK